MGGLTGVDRLHLSDVVIVKVAVGDVRRRLVIAGDVRHVRDNVLFRQHAYRQHSDEAQRLTSFVTHQAHRTFIDDAVKRGQILVFTVLQSHEMILQIRPELASLFRHVREVDEEPGAHVALQKLHLALRSRAETPHQQVAVLQQTSAPDLLGIPRADQFPLQVVQGDGEVAVNALSHDGGVEGLGHGVLGALVEEQERVQVDLERVHAELELTPEGIDELELHVLPAVVRQGD